MINVEVVALGSNVRIWTVVRGHSRWNPDRALARVDERGKTEYQVAHSRLEMDAYRRGDPPMPIAVKWHLSNGYAAT